MLLDSVQLANKLKISDFQNKTKKQLAKDFATLGIHFSVEFMEQNQSFESVITTIAIKLNEAIQMGQALFLQLIYTLDVDESLFLNALGKENALHELSELILRREAYKVFLRERFS